MDRTEQLLREEFSRDDAALRLDPGPLLARVTTIRRRRTATTAATVAALAVVAAGAVTVSSQGSGPGGSTAVGTGQVTDTANQVEFADAGHGFALRHECALRGPGAPTGDPGRPGMAGGPVVCSYAFAVTSDAGATWQRRAMPESTSDGAALRQLWVFDKQTVMIGLPTDGNRRWLSTDGGTSWTRPSGDTDLTVASVPHGALLARTRGQAVATSDPGGSVQPTSPQAPPADSPATPAGQPSDDPQGGTQPPTDPAPAGSPPADAGDDQQGAPAAWFTVRLPDGRSARLPGPSDAELTSEVVAAGNGSFWVGCVTSGDRTPCVSVSTDQGRTWRTTPLRVPGLAASGRVPGPDQVSTVDGRTVYLTIRTGPAGGRADGLGALLRSTDAGHSWASLRLPDGAYSTDSAALPSGDLVGVVGLRIALLPAAGAAFRVVPDSPHPVRSLYRSGPYLVVRTDDGANAAIYLSTDGADWSPITPP